MPRRGTAPVGFRSASSCPIISLIVSWLNKSSTRSSSGALGSRQPARGPACTPYCWDAAGLLGDIRHSLSSNQSRRCLQAVLQRFTTVR